LFIVAKKECSVLEDRTADANALAVVLKCSFLLTYAIQVPGVGVIPIALVKPIGIPMERIATRFANKRDLSARRTAKRRVRVRDANLKFIQALHSRRYEILRSGAPANRVVGYIDAIH